ncbi:maleylpyruvate isomerase family mycothiol-dependent enzyme [Nocardioides sp. YR527]|uniref:maleylpyruvate isomerase family mycothiol-dependent enzyme n=1 Tax=Nocardioides sp. YR527 TaxID=1881028 RepID=UPI000B815101|nr:maleylpyruvate isomerase family mycothiol-dependent enzyme [Nocardioides sp. YR527]
MTTRLTPAAYIDHIRSESARFRAVLADTDPTAPVPTAPEWTAADLLWHVAAEVQHFWTYVLETRPTAPTEEAYDEPERPKDASYQDLLAHFDELNARFIKTLEQTGPEEPTWSWSQDQSAAFTYRRQAHEILIHRLDAELTADALTPLDPALAADGIDEILDVFYGGKPEWATFAGDGRYVRVDAVDTDTRTWVELGLVSGTRPDGDRLEDEPDLSVLSTENIPADTEPDVVIEGTAADLDAWLWRRRDDEGIRVAGDRDIYDSFRALTNQAIKDDD